MDEVDGTPLTTTFASNSLRKFFSRGQLRQDRAEQQEFLRTRQTAIARRQAQSANPARLQELLGMINDAQKLGNNDGEGREDGNEENEKERDDNI